MTFLLLTGCSYNKNNLTNTFKNTKKSEIKQHPNKINKQDSVISKSPKVISSKQEKRKIFDFNGTWLAQETSSFVQRKLSLKKVNETLHGTLELTYITTRGEIYDKESFEVLIYLKDESIDGYISSDSISENISIFRDSNDTFTLKVNEKRSKYFDTNEIRFIKYKNKKEKRKKVELIFYDDYALDKTNKVIWQDAIANRVLKSNYYMALDYCKKLNHLGFDDWYLPTRKELKSIIKNNKFKYKIDSDYWSQTASLDQYGKAWYLDHNKVQMGIDEKLEKKYIRCIRKKNKNEKNFNKSDSNISYSNSISSPR